MCHMRLTWGLGKLNEIFNTNVTASTLQLTCGLECVAVRLIDNSKQFHILPFVSTINWDYALH